MTEHHDKELRIGLVLYGGVSLAIYIYGVVFEFLRLVREEGPYAEVTQTARIKPIIDVISGSSAGGINGLFLAKALATKTDLSALKEVWIQQGDLETLVNADNKEPKSLLDSDYYQDQLYEALTHMQPTAGNPTTDGAPNLLDLFITATNLDGIVSEYGQPFFRSPIHTKHYGTVFHFKARPNHYNFSDLLEAELDTLEPHSRLYLQRMVDKLKEDRYMARNDFHSGLANPTTSLPGNDEKIRYLARIAASTSAFPIAFSPVPFKKQDMDRLKSLFHPDIFGSDLSELGIRQKESSQNVVYGDGGMVNNKPFSHTVRTIFERQADGPVDRKLFFVEPDPASFDEERRLGDRGQPADGFDSLQNFFTASFYESISADLEGLVRQNERIINIRQILIAFENQLSEYISKYSEHLQTSTDYRRMHQAQPVYGTYRQIKITGIRQELETKFVSKTDVEALILEVKQTSLKDFPQDNRAYQELFVQDLIQQTLANILEETYGTLQFDEEEISGFLRQFDYHFRIRRLRYFITKLDAWLRQIDLMPDIDQEDEAVKSLQLTLGNLKGKLYAFIEFYKHRVWQIWENAPLITKIADIKPTFAYVADEYQQLMDRHYKEVMFEVMGVDLVRTVKEVQLLRPMLPPQPGEYLELRQTSDFIETMLSSCPDDQTKICLDQIFNTYEFLDMYLYPAAVLANIGEADPVEVIRISPKDAVRYRETVQDKLAGEKLMHFSAFLKRSWRENDLLWGRLDAAEIIVNTIFPEDKEKANQFLDKLCPSIIKEELTSIRQRRETEITQSILTDGEQSHLKRILEEQQALGPTQDFNPAAIEAYLRTSYTPGMQGFEDIAQNYLLRTSAKTLRTISRMFELRSNQSKAQGANSALIKPIQYLTSLLNLPYLFLVTLGGAEESQRKKLFNFSAIIGVILLALHFIGGLVLESWLLLALVVFILFYLRPKALIGVVILALALIISLLTSGAIEISVQNPWAAK